MCRKLFLAFTLLAFISCGNSPGNKSEKDAASETTNTMGEDNHVMENNVNTEPKKVDNTTLDERAADSARWQTMVDTTVGPATDTLSKR